MKSNNPTKHNRQSIRLRGWDYTRPGAYFITICTHRRENLFDEARFRVVVENGWLAIPNHSHAQHVTLDEWVVMPNHLHGILLLNEMHRPDGDDHTGRGETIRRGGRLQSDVQSDLPRPYTTHDAKLKAGSVGAIVGNFKSLAAKRINNLRRTPGAAVWQRGYYDRIVRNERELNAIRQYIQDNPQRWAEDRENLESLLGKMERRELGRTNDLLENFSPPPGATR